MVPLTISAQNGIINQYDYFDKQIASLNLSNYYILRNGDFAYNKSYSNGYPYGTVKRLDKFEEGALSSLYICFKVINVDSNYLTFYFDSNKWNREVKLISGEGARNHGLLNLSPVDFFNMKLFISSNNKEQIKIAYFLKLLNRKIKLLSLKIQALKKYKEGLIQQTLKSTIKVPLKKIINESLNKTVTNNQYVLLSSTAKGIFLQSDFFNHQVASKNNIGYKILEEGQIVFSPQNLWLGNINLLTKYKIGCVSPSYKIFDINTKIVDSNYLIEIMRTKLFLHKYKLCSEQGASVVRRNLDLDQFLNIRVPIPSNDKFYSLLKEINYLIEKESSKLNIIISIKNYLLKNMFI